MGYEVIGKVPSIKDLLAKYPLNNSDLDEISQHRDEIKAIIANNDERKLIIVGPCSAWPYEACIEYAQQLKILQAKVANKLKLVMRVYTQKPRTIKGWLGIANQPDPFLEPNIYQGIEMARSLMTKIVKIGIPIADEALFTSNMYLLIDLISWVAIGARSSENQDHRIYASSLDCAVGIKNPTSGSLAIGLNGVIASQDSHHYVYNNYAIKTSGNVHSHLVLRGGNGVPNYLLADLQYLSDFYQDNIINNPSFIIDVSHDNCIINGLKDFSKQGDIIFDIMSILKQNHDIAKYFKGFMLESFLKSGNQSLDNEDNIDLGGLSITDPCIDFKTTQEIILNLANILN
jgi:3-deoxy-7-phosphoheptulonate synthase